MGTHKRRGSAGKRISATVYVTAGAGKAEYAARGFGILVTLNVLDKRWKSHLTEPLMKIQPALSQSLQENAFSQRLGFGLEQGQHGIVLPYLLSGDYVAAMSDAGWLKLVKSAAAAHFRGQKSPVPPVPRGMELPEPLPFEAYGFLGCFVIPVIAMYQDKAWPADIPEENYGVWAKNLAQVLRDGLEKDLGPVDSIDVMPMLPSLSILGYAVREWKEACAELFHTQGSGLKYAPFYTYNEWRKRYADELTGVDPESLGALYGSFLKKWYANMEAMAADRHPIEVLKVDTDKMRDYIDHNDLDESEEESWSEAARATGHPVRRPIIELIDRNPEISARDVVATITSHTVDGKTDAYILAQIHTRNEEVVATYAVWNPLILNMNDATEVFFEKLSEEGAKELRVVKGRRAVEVRSGKLVGQTSGSEMEDVTTSMAGRFCSD